MQCPIIASSHDSWQGVKERGVPTDDEKTFVLSALRMRSLTLCRDGSFEFRLLRISSVRFWRGSKSDAKNVHCLTRSNKCTSEAAIALNVCDLRMDS